MTEKAQRAQARRLLVRWGKTTAFCARRQREIVDYEQLIAGVGDIKPQQLTGMPFGGGTSDTTAWSAAQLEELKRRYNDRIGDLKGDIKRELDFASAMDQMLVDLEPIELTVLEYRYKHDRKPQNVAICLGYSLRQVERIEQEAVDKLRDCIEITVMT